MLTDLDHLVLLTRDFEGACADYQTLLGAAPDWQGRDEHFRTAVFQTGNAGLEIMSPVAGGQSAARVDEILGTRDSLLTSLVFGTDNIEIAHHVLGRRGLQPGEISDENKSTDGGHTRAWRRFRLADTMCAGIKTFVLQHKSSLLTHNIDNGLRLDHLVINTANPERTIAHYGARLGLRFALDRTTKAFGARFLFFRIGGLTLEIIHRLGKEHDPESDDKFWGLTWAVDDLPAMHERLATSGVTVSEIRTGRKPGSKVFTVKSHSAGIPTLFIAHEPRRA